MSEDQRFAFIENGIVTNVIIAKAGYTSEKGLIVQSNTANIGDKYNGKDFSSSQKTFKLKVDDYVKYTHSVVKLYIKQGTVFDIDGQSIEINNSNSHDLLFVAQYAQMNPNAKITFENILLLSPQVIKLFNMYCEYMERMKEIGNVVLKDIRGKKIKVENILTHSAWPYKLQRVI